MIIIHYVKLITLNYIYFFIYLFVNNSLLLAKLDDSTNREASYNVRYEGKIKSKEDVEKKKSILQSIGEFLLGKEQKQLMKPYAILADDSSNIVVLDQGLESLVKIDMLNSHFEYLDNDTGINFPSLVGITKINNQTIAFTDSRLNKIYIYDLKKNKVKAFNDFELSQPTGIAYSAKDKQFWVVETAKHRVLILNEQGQIVRAIGIRGSSPGEFNFPTNICIDKTGKVYIVDAMNFRVQIYSLDGEFISTFGQQGDASGYFASPKGIATDTFGHIFIVDAMYHSVQVFNEKGDYLYCFGKQGRNDGEFWLPTGIYINNDNHIYVTDSYNSRIQVFRLLLRN